jgi:hypothetical protein
MNSDQRAENYRREAARLRELAAKELQGSIVKRQLLDLAEEFDRLADQVTEKRLASDR